MKKLLFILLIHLTIASMELDENPLQYAVKLDSFELVQLFVNFSFDVNAQDGYGNNALHYAAVYTTDPRTINLLLSKNPNLSRVNKYGHTPYGLAKMQGKNILAGVLKLSELEQKIAACSSYALSRIDTNQEQLPSTNNQEETIDLPLAKVIIPTKKIKNPGLSPLHVACINNEIDNIKNLITTKINILTPDNFGNTPLDYAFCKGYQEATTLLLNASNHPYTKNILLILEKTLELSKVIHNIDKNKDTLLHKAVEGNNIYLVKFLIALGANTNAQNAQGKSPIDLVKEKSSDLSLYLQGNYYIRHPLYTRQRSHLQNNLEWIMSVIN